MHSYTYDRLSAQDNLFLVMESTETPMHIGAVMVLEAGGCSLRMAASTSGATNAASRACCT